MNKTQLVKLLEKQTRLIDIHKKYPLAFAKLWTPHCHRWDGSGSASERERGCGKPMTLVRNNTFYCPRCDITEQRTSQRSSLLNMGREAHMIGGGNRAGKTQIGAMLSIATAAGSGEWWVQQWLKTNNLPFDLVPSQPSTVWCVSISFGDSIEYIRPKLDQYLPQGTKRTRWNAQDRASAELPNGGKLICLSYEMGRAKFQGSAVSMIWMDEEGRDESVFEECLLRCVDYNARIVLTCTPLNGLSWLYDKFVEKTLDGFTRTQISGLDNPYISSVKLKRAVQHMSEASQRTRLFGDFTSQHGLVYDEFDPAIHVVQPFDIPADGVVMRSIDFGTRNPWCTLWIYHDVKGVFGADDSLYVYREYYQRERTTIENGRETIRRSQHDPKPIFTVADSASRDGRLILARELKLPTKPSPKELGLLTMINLVKDRLMVQVDGLPRLFVFNTCPNLISEFKKYKWSKNPRDEKVVKSEDHALDSLRYAVGYMSRYNKINQ